MARRAGGKARVLMTPILLQQFRLFYTSDRPVGVVLWAQVNDEVAKNIADGATRIRPQDWRSGENLWVVEVIAPFESADACGHPKRRQNGAEEMVKDLKEKVFPARTINYVAVSRDGKKDVRAV